MTWTAPPSAKPATASTTRLPPVSIPSPASWARREQRRDLSDAIALKKEQERAVSADMRTMLEAVVLPEARQPADYSRSEQLIPAPVPERKIRALSTADKAAIETAKSAGAQARTALDAPTYTPSSLKRFPD